MRSVRSWLLASGLIASLLLGATPLAAPTTSPQALSQQALSQQAWPQRAVKFLLPLGPGSGVDIGTRLLADRLSARWGQPVVVEHNAISAFVNAHDDHLLLATPTSSFTAHPYLHEN